MPGRTCEGIWNGTFRTKAVLLAIVPVLSVLLFLLNGGALGFHADRGMLSRSG
jgi:hypothetical protein